MSAQHRTAVIEPDATVAAELVAACPTGTTVCTARQLALPDNDDTLVVVIGPSVSEVDAARTTEHVTLKHPRAGVVLIRRRLDTATVMTALRSGAREVLTERDLVDLNRVIDRTRAQCARVRPADPNSSATAHARITTVFSAKGGVGKTTVSTNLAVCLAGRGHRVCLVDLDVAFGDVAVTLNLFPHHTLVDAAHLGDDLDHRALSGMLVHHNSGVQVLAAPFDPASAESVSPSSISKALSLLAEHFDHIIIDTPPALDDRVLVALDVSTLVILVATLDVPALKNLRLAIETLSAIGIDSTVQRVVLNRANDDAGVRLADVAGALGRTVDVTIPTAREVPASINEGTALVSQAPAHAVSKAIATIADHCLGESASVNVGTTAVGRVARRGRRTAASSGGRR